MKEQFDTKHDVPLCYAVEIDKSSLSGDIETLIVNVNDITDDK